jgi:hypothetical protein
MLARGMQRRSPGMSAEPHIDHAADRWAKAVAGMLDSPFDPKTVAMWGKAIGVSEGALRDWCRVAHCRPKSSLDLARLLRAIVQSQEYGWDPFNLLDVANERTMKNLLQRGGLSGLLTADRPLTPRGFLFEQHFVTNALALEALAESVERLAGAPKRRN